MSRSPTVRRLALAVVAGLASVAVAACGSSTSSSGTGSVSISASNAANTSNKNLNFYEVNNGCASDPFWAAISMLSSRNNW